MLKTLLSAGWIEPTMPDKPRRRRGHEEDGVRSRFLILKSEKTRTQVVLSAAAFQVIDPSHYFGYPFA
jgi:hypothetical protein